MAGGDSIASDANSAFGKEGSLLSKSLDKFNKLFSVGQDFNKQARQEVFKLSKQVMFTEELIRKNRSKIEKVAETDQTARAFLDRFDQTNFKNVSSLIETIDKNGDISREQGAELVKTFEQMGDSLSNLKLDNLELGMTDMVSHLMDAVNSDQLGRDVQRKFVNDFIAFSSNAEDLDVETKDLVAQLVAQQELGLNFDKDQVETLNGIIGQFDNDKIDKIKTKGTLDSINNTMGDFVVNQREIIDTLEETQLDGESLSEMLKKGLDSDIGGGILELAFAALGLPGFVGTFSAIGGMLTSVKNVISSGFTKLFGKGGHISKLFGKGGTLAKVTGKIGKMFGSVGKLAKPLLKAGKFLKFIPVVGTIISGIVGLFDAVHGFFNAEEIAGKTTEMLTLGDKIQASIASFISGLTFGFVSAETVFKKIDEADEAIFGADGYLNNISDFFSNMYSKISDSDIVNASGEVVNSIIDGMEEFWKSLSEGIEGMFSKILNFDFSSLLPDSVQKLLGMNDEPSKVSANGEDKGIFDSVADGFKSFFSEDSGPSTASASFRAESKAVGNNAAVSLSRESAIGNNQQVQPVIIQGGSQQSNNTDARQVGVRKNQVDDSKLAMLNMGLMD